MLDHRSCSSPGDRTSKGLADLPPKVFARIIDNLCRPTAEGLTYNDDWPRIQEEEAQQRKTLGILSLFNDDLRKLAQPLLWKKASLGYRVKYISKHTSRYESIFAARPESRGWPETLDVQWGDHRNNPIAEETLSAVSRVLAGFKSISRLSIGEVYDVVEQAPAQLFACLTELHITEITSSLGSFQSVISRCQNLTHLTIGIFHPGDLGITITAETVPLLKQLQAPHALAAMLVPGRPVEELTLLEPRTGKGSVALRWSQLAPLAGGTKPLRSLRIESFLWGNGCLGAIAAQFPSLESLKLKVHEQPNGWLETRLVEIVELFPAIQTLEVTPNESAFSPKGPPSTQQLQATMEILKAASIVRPGLKKISYSNSLTWTGDGTGFWAALYEGRFGRPMYLTPSQPPPPVVIDPITRIRPARHPNDRLTTLPGEMLLEVVGSMKRPIDEDVWWPHRPALLALCLTNETLRAVAQPLLFSRINFRGKVAETLFVARKLEEMFNTREGSDQWPRELILKWETARFTGMGGHDWPGIEDPEAVGPKEEMVQLTTTLMTRMTNLRAFKAEQLALSPEIYAKLYRLPKLERVKFASVTFNGPLQDGDQHIRISDLALTHVSILTGQGGAESLFGPYIIPEVFTQMARCTTLQELHLIHLTSEVVAELVGPSHEPLVNLHTLQVEDQSTPFQCFVDLAPYTPNLRSFVMGRSRSSGEVGSLPESIPATMWPLLKRFEGSVTIAQLIVPGHSLEDITIQAGGGRREKEELARDSLADLARGSEPLRSLSVCNYVWNPSIIQDIGNLFPDLETLYVSGNGDDVNYFANDYEPKGDDWLLGHLEEVVQMFPKLWSVQIFQGGYSESKALERKVLKEQADVLETAKALRPSLCKVSFNGMSKWFHMGVEGWVLEDYWGTKYSTAYEALE